MITRVVVGWPTIQVYADVTDKQALQVCHLVTFNVAGRGDNVAVHIGDNAMESWVGSAGEPCVRA